MSEPIAPGLAPGVDSVTGTARGRMLLAVASVLFGSMFVPAQRALDDLTPAGATSLRFLISMLVVAPFCRRDVADVRARPRDYLIGGLLAGGANTLGFFLQSMALQRTSASSTAFLSTLFVVFVPLMSAVLARHLPSPWVVGGVSVAVVGSFLLTGASLSVNPGDALAVAAAVCGAFHVLFMGHFAVRLSGPAFNFAQMAAVAVMAAGIGLFTGFGDLSSTALTAVLYLGVAMAGGLGLQVVAQRDVDPTSSALILLLIPVVGAVLAVVLVDDPVTLTRVLGAGLVLCAVVIAEVLPSRRTAAALRRTATPIPTPTPVPEGGST